MPYLPRACVDCGKLRRTRSPRCMKCFAAHSTGRLKPRKPPAQRFWRFVAKTETCWLWTGAGNGHGYGIFTLARNKKVAAHRFAYELLVGPIPEGLDLDHLCRNRICVNPAHLEPVTRRENLRRGLLARDALGRFRSAA